MVCCNQRCNFYCSVNVSPLLIFLLWRRCSSESNHLLHCCKRWRINSCETSAQRFDCTSINTRFYLIGDDNTTFLRDNQRPQFYVLIGNLGYALHFLWGILQPKAPKKTADCRTPFLKHSIAIHAHTYRPQPLYFGVGMSIDQRLLLPLRPCVIFDNHMPCNRMSFINSLQGFISVLRSHLPGGRSITQGEFLRTISSILRWRSPGEQRIYRQNMSAACRRFTSSSGPLARSHTSLATLTEWCSSVELEASSPTIAPDRATILELRGPARR